MKIDALRPFAIARLMALLALLGLASCGDPSAGQARVPTPRTARSLAVTMLDQQTWLAAPEQLIVRPSLYIFNGASDVESFAALMTTPQGLSSQAYRLVEQLRDVDYTQAFGLLAMLENGDGQQLTVREVLREEGTLMVYADERRPQPGEGQTADVRAPYHAVVVAKDPALEWNVPLNIYLVVNDAVIAEARLAGS